MARPTTPAPATMTSALSMILFSVRGFGGGASGTGPGGRGGGALGGVGGRPPRRGGTRPRPVHSRFFAVGGLGGGAGGGGGRLVARARGEIKWRRRAAGPATVRPQEIEDRG